MAFDQAGAKELKDELMCNGLSKTGSDQQLEFGDSWLI